MVNNHLYLQSAALVVAAHPSLTDDTLVLFSEADFKFNKEDLAAHDKWVAAVDLTIGTNAPLAGVKAGVASGGGHIPGASQAIDTQGDFEYASPEFNAEYARYAEAARLHGWAEWDPKHEMDNWMCSELHVESHENKYPPTVKVYHKGHKPAAADFKDECVSIHLKDIVSYATAAHRVGRGGFVWLGWNAEHWGPHKDTRACSPFSGAQLFCCTSQFAREFLPILLKLSPNKPMMHTGTLFREIIGLKMQESLKACYVCPPIGGFTTHASTTSLGRTLHNHFDAKWSQEGTRVTKPEHKHRRICAFTAHGHANFLTDDIRLPADEAELRWTTQAPPGLPECFTGWQPRHMGIKERSS